VSITDRPTTGTPHVRLELGALVLGALDVDERARVEAHVAGCEECRAELAELAPLPGLLRRVSEADLLRPPEAVSRSGAEAVPDLVPGVVARADRAFREQRARRHRRWAVVGVAAALVGGVAVGTGALMADLPAHEAAAAPVVVRADDPITGIHAEVTLHSSPTGTDLALRLSGVPAGEECRLVAQAGAQRDVTATWDATYNGEATFTGSTRFAVDQIDTLIIETPAGKALVTMPVG
jgi:anti-sigma factor RsiW